MKNIRNYERRYESAIARQIAHKMAIFDYLKKIIKTKPEDFAKSEEYVKRVADDPRHAIGVRKDDDSKSKEIADVRKAANEVLSYAIKHRKKQGDDDNSVEVVKTSRRQQGTDTKAKR